MSHVEAWDIDASGDSQLVSALTRTGIDAHTAAKHFTRMVPNGASVRSLQAAADPDRYNLRDYPSVAQQADLIRYTTEEITFGAAKADPDFDGRIVDDDHYDFEDDDVVFVRHVWSVPNDLPQIR